MNFANIPTWDQWMARSSLFFESRTGPAKSVDDLVKRYYHVQEVAKLNILMALKDAIVKWEDDKIARGVASRREEAMTALMEVVLRKLRELDGWGKQRALRCASGHWLERQNHEPDAGGDFQTKSAGTGCSCWGQLFFPPTR